MNQTEIAKVLALHGKWLLGDAHGKRANFRGADLRGAYLRYEDLRGADLRYADLRDADCDGADFRDADCGGANFGGANLRCSDCGGANFDGANFDGADLGDVLWETYLSDVVPALLTAGGKTLAEVATPATWACHRWYRVQDVVCPIATAFDCDSLAGVPPLYRQQAERFVQFFDAGLVPLPGEGR